LPDSGARRHNILAFLRLRLCIRQN